MRELKSAAGKEKVCYNMVNPQHEQFIVKREGRAPLQTSPSLFVGFFSCDKFLVTIGLFYFV